MNTGIAVNDRVDFMGRLTRFMETTDPIWIIVALTGVLVLLVLGLFGRRRELLFLLVSAATFSGAMWASVDAGSTMVRWIILGLLALNCLRLHTYPGTPMMFFMMYGVIGFVCVMFSDVMVWSLQTAMLLMLTVLTGIALSDEMQNRADIRRVLYIYLLATSAWLVMGLLTLRTLITAGSVEGERVSGVTTSAPLFVITGGLLLPIAMWGALCGRKTWGRVLCAGLALSLVLLLFASGQRTGFFGGVLGCVPLMFRKKAANLILLLLIGLGVSLFGARMAAANARQSKFLMKRYVSTDTTGRTQIWSEAITEIMRSPFLGRGHGGDRAFGMKYHHPTHNALLSAWYNTGVFGLAMYLGAFAVGGWQSLTMIRRGHDQEVRDLGRLFLGLLITEFAVGMFETTSSPSNFATITLVILMALVGRMAQISREEARQMAYWRPGTMRYMWVPNYPLGAAAGGGYRAGG